MTFCLYFQHDNADVLFCTFNWFGLVCRAQDMFGPMNDGEPFLLLD